MSQRYRDVLDYEIGARIVVEFTTRGRDVVDYAVVLTVDDEENQSMTVRVYDGAHGVNDMHPAGPIRREGAGGDVPCRYSWGRDAGRDHCDSHRLQGDD
jgi:hypothetical protein